MKKFTKIITLAALAFLFVGCVQKEEVKRAPTMEEIQKEKGKPVRVATASTMDLNDVRTFNGAISGVQPATAIAKLSDPIKKIHVKIGSKVTKDQLLAEFEYTGDNIQLKQLEETVKLQEDVTRRLKEVYEKGGVSQQDLEAQEMQLRISKMQLEAVRRANQVLAPADGIVTEILYDEGEVPSVGSKMFSTAKLDKVILTLSSVTTKDIGLFKNGLKATVEMNGKTLTGKVTRVPMAANPVTRFFPVEITFNNSNRQLLPGMFVAASINTAVVKGVSVPNDAVIYSNGLNYVWTVEDGKAKRNLVQVGVADENFTQIKSGIEDNAVVIIDGMSRLDDSDKVLIVE
ncbi:MAG: efflux RND transporter periplasmic adaptor subunit [Fibrobacteraceae bacterium]|jgi:RND family efflux transporter MFP subunit|nr:efflux RND transporter periplasmic adaptor subunit [Fibrobacteraceae bacterium]